jgi:hypothetical protein
MSARSPEPTRQAASLDANANSRQSNAAFVPLGLRLVRIDAGRRLVKMERLFRNAGNRIGRMEALATLRSWQVDPRFDSASRQRASALLWKVQPNGWDEV